MSGVRAEVERFLHGFYHVTVTHLRSSISRIGSWDRHLGNLETKGGVCEVSTLCCTPKIEKQQHLNMKTWANPLFLLCLNPWLVASY